MLYGTLLVGGQVVVYDILARDVVLLDDILPSILRAAVGQIEIHEIVVLQSLVFLLTVRERCLAGTAPCAPDVEQDEATAIRLSDFTEYLFAIAHIGHVIVCFQNARLRDVTLLYFQIFVLQRHNGSFGRRQLHFLFHHVDSGIGEGIARLVDSPIELASQRDVTQCAVAAYGIKDCQCLAVTSKIHLVLQRFPQALYQGV